MAKWRDFGATNEDKTCLWCGLGLRPQRENVQPEEHGFSNTEYGTPRWKAFVKEQPIVGYGDYRDGFFCGLRCAYLFAEGMAKNGRRFDPKKGPS